VTKTSKTVLTIALVIAALALVAGVVYDRQRNTLSEAEIRATTGLPASTGTEVSGSVANPGTVTFSVLGDALSVAPPDGQGWVERFGTGLCWSLLDRFAAATNGYTDRVVTDPPTNTSFSNRVPDVISKKPQVVIVQGGALDAQQPREAITAAALGVFGSLRSGLGDQARIVAVGPMPTPTVDAASLATASSAISAAAVPFGVTFIDPLAQGWLAEPGMFDASGVFPNDQGYEEMANRLEAGFREPGVTPTSACAS
jgi:lysophospholipase L1-like esterase